METIEYPHEILMRIFNYKRLLTCLWIFQSLLLVLTVVIFLNVPYNPVLRQDGSSATSFLFAVLMMLSIWSLAGLFSSVIFQMLILFGDLAKTRFYFIPWSVFSFGLIYWMALESTAVGGGLALGFSAISGIVSSYLLYKDPRAY